MNAKQHEGLDLPTLRKSGLLTVSGIEYHLHHLRSFSHVYDITLDGIAVPVPLRIVFSDHCYTRSREENDDAAEILLIGNGDSIEERAFCLDRWEFSKRLPTIIRELPDKHCLHGKNTTAFYRVEDQVRQRPDVATYICLQFEVDNKRETLALKVKSAHHRQNKPYDVRGRSERFSALLRRYYLAQKPKRKWLK